MGLGGTVKLSAKLPSITYNRYYTNSFNHTPKLFKKQESFLLATEADLFKIVLDKGYKIFDFN
jgi:hypothetical protein